MSVGWSLCQTFQNPCSKRLSHHQSSLSAFVATPTRWLRFSKRTMAIASTECRRRRGCLFELVWLSWSLQLYRHTSDEAVMSNWVLHADMDLAELMYGMCANFAFPSKNPTKTTKKIRKKEKPDKKSKALRKHRVHFESLFGLAFGRALNKEQWSRRVGMATNAFDVLFRKENKGFSRCQLCGDCQPRQHYIEATMISNHTQACHRLKRLCALKAAVRSRMNSIPASQWQ